MTPDPANPHNPNLDWSIIAAALIRGRWIILAALAVALTIGVAIIEFAPRAYTAETTLEIEREPQKVAAVGSAIPAETLFGADETAQTQYGLLHSRGLAVRVGRMLGLDRQAAYVRESPAGGGATRSIPRASPRKSGPRLKNDLRATHNFAGSEAELIPDKCLSPRVAPPRHARSGGCHPCQPRTPDRNMDRPAPAGAGSCLRRAASRSSPASGRPPTPSS